MITFKSILSLKKLDASTLPVLDTVDRKCVTRQIGRDPRGMMAVAVRCFHNNPAVVLVSARIPDKDRELPFPTVLWLSCPLLKKAVATLESSGKIKAWEKYLGENEAVAAKLNEAHKYYIELQAAMGDPGEGIAGVKDHRYLKCLHAHLAHFLAAGSNPIGAMVLNKMELPEFCPHIATCRCKD